MVFFLFILFPHFPDYTSETINSKTPTFIIFIVQRPNGQISALILFHGTKTNSKNPKCTKTNSKNPKCTQTNSKNPKCTQTNSKNPKCTQTNSKNPKCTQTNSKNPKCTQTNSKNPKCTQTNSKNPKCTQTNSKNPKCTQTNSKNPKCTQTNSKNPKCTQTNSKNPKCAKTISQKQHFISKTTEDLLYIIEVLLAERFTYRVLNTSCIIVCLLLKSSNKLGQTNLNSLGSADIRSQSWFSRHQVARSEFSHRNRHDTDTKSNFDYVICRSINVFNACRCTCYYIKITYNYQPYVDHSLVLTVLTDRCSHPGDVESLCHTLAYTPCCVKRDLHLRCLVAQSERYRKQPLDSTN
ncbi:DYHC2-like protein [Mya arenaria]|uniref:DYHC2-like protein n=1 Tax=Mya arenaria TaxID=6604 RepID=A0ABY7FZQ3_MYAAR|nr:DYHC2-like protein [Mya arenaria]